LVELNIIFPHPAMESRTYLIVFVAICHCLLFCSANFVKHPNNDADLRAVYKRSFELECIYNGADGQPEFGEWYRDDKLISSEKQGHYVVKNTDTKSTLIIKIFVMADGEARKWYLKSSKANHPDSIACEFNQIKPIPSPQGLQTNRGNERIESVHDSIRRVEDEVISLKCLIKPDTQTGDGSTALQWEYSIDEKTFNPINAEGVQVNGDTLTIDQVKKFHRGYYRCSMNNVSFTVLLRVKDHLAALWPFLGIVGIVVVLVIVILIFERRQKKTRRTMGNDEDDNDHANDPLVRSQNRTSDNDNKKRAVRA